VASIVKGCLIQTKPDLLATLSALYWERDRELFHHGRVQWVDDGVLFVTSCHSLVALVLADAVPLCTVDRYHFSFRMLYCGTYVIVRPPSDEPSTDEPSTHLHFLC